MQDGICPKCNSTEIYRGLVDEGEGLTAGSYLSQIEVAAGKSEAILRVETYICRDCGYVEIYVANQNDLQILERAESWVKVTRRDD